MNVTKSVLKTVKWQLDTMIMLKVKVKQLPKKATLAPWAL